MLVGSFAGSAKAFPPPAGDMLIISQAARCQVELSSISVPDSYFWRNDVVPIDFTIKNIGDVDPTNDRLKLKFRQLDSNNDPIPPKDAVDIEWLSEFLPGFSVSETDEPWTVISQGLKDGQSKSFTLYFRIGEKVGLGKNIDLKFSLYNPEKAGCTDSKHRTVKPAPNFDLDLSSLSPAEATRKEHQSIEYTAKLTNNGPSNLAGVKVGVDFTTSSGLIPDFKNGDKPDCFVPDPKLSTTNGWPNSGTKNRVVCYQIYDDFPVDTTKTFTLNYLDLPKGDFAISSCAYIVGVYANFEKDETGKDCKQAHLEVEAPMIKIIKRWEDAPVGQGQEHRSLKPGDLITTTIKIKNLDPSKAATDIRITDQPSVECDKQFPQSCASLAFDQSINWVDTADCTVDSDRASVLHCGAYTIPASGEKVITLKAKVVGLQPLAEALRTYGFSNYRCNEASLDHFASIASGFCWDYVTDQASANLSIDSNFTDGSQVDKDRNGNSRIFREVPQGGSARYKLTATNKGPVPATKTRIGDLQIDSVDNQHVKNTEAHYITFDPTSLGPNGKLDPNNPHQLSWLIDNMPGSDSGAKQDQFGYFDANGGFVSETEVLTPRFFVACDTPENLILKSTLRNRSSITSKVTDPDTTNNQSTTYLKVTTANSNLKLSYQLVPAGPLRPKDTFTLKLIMTNKAESGKPVDVALPLVTATASFNPSIFSVVGGAISSGGSQNGSTLSWTVDELGIEGEATVSADLKINASAGKDTYYIPAHAESVTKGAFSDCGKSSIANPGIAVNVAGSDLVLTKTIAAGDNQLKIGERVTFNLDVTNQSNVAKEVTNPGEMLHILDNLDPALTYDPAIPVTCLFASPPTTDQSNFQKCDDSLTTPELAGQTMQWDIASIPAQTEYIFSFGTKVPDTFPGTVCPQGVKNQLKLALPDGTIDQASPDIDLEIYPELCIDGNIYSRSQNQGQNPSIKVNDKAIINPSSVLSANGSIECGGSGNCSKIPFVIPNYGTDGQSSVGANLPAVVKRMHTNIQNSSQGASTLPTINTNSIFDLQTGQFLTDPNATQTSRDPRYLDGRTWKVAGDLTLETPIRFKGKGTIIVYGNLHITGNSSISYTNETTADNTVGFIVLPTSQKTGGGIFVDEGVTKIVGAYYAPGTQGEDVDSPANATEAGLIQFKGPGTTQLLPARGLFIAREFKFERKEFVIQYNPFLSQQVPPAFQFTTSPSDTSETP